MKDRRGIDPTSLLCLDSTQGEGTLATDVEA